MEILMLSGNSLANRDWIYQVQKELGEMTKRAYVQNYAHWENGKDWIDLPHELDALEEAVKDKTDYGVFAKSIGTVLAVQAIDMGIIKPRFLLFTGLPLNYITGKYQQFGTVLDGTNIPLTIIQNTNDPVGNAEDVREYLVTHVNGQHNYKFITSEGTTHDYEDYELLRTQLASLSAL